MDYPTDPLILQRMTADEWQELLARLNATPPKTWRTIIVYEMEFDRKRRILEMKAQGMKSNAIAKALGVSPSLITRILNGTRR